MKARWLLIVGLALCPLSVLAQAPGDEPPRHGGGGGGYGYGGHEGMFNPPTSEELKEWHDFLANNSPHRLQLLESLVLPHSHPLRMKFIAKWRRYKVLRHDNPEAADLYLKRFHLEDDLLGFAMELRDLKGDSARQADTKTKIHDTVAQLVQMDVDEQAKRIESMQKALKAEQEKLDKQKADFEQSVSEQINKVEQSADRLPANNPPQTQPSSAP